MARWSTETTFKHPWETVVQSAVHKYPNPYSTHLVASDVTYRHFHVPTQTLFTQKLFTGTFPMFPISSHVYACENSLIRPQEKLMVLETVNLSLSSIMQVHEHLEYVPHPKNANWTLLTHKTTLSAPSWFVSSIKKTALENTEKGRQAIEWVVNNRLPLLANGISETISSAFPKLTTSHCETMNCTESVPKKSSQSVAGEHGQDTTSR